MERYYVNRNAQPTTRGEHEVHRDNGTCPHPPDQENRVDLGNHSNCRSALNDAENRGYRPADGCAYCVPDCHST